MASRNANSPTMPPSAPVLVAAALAVLTITSCVPSPEPPLAARAGDSTNAAVAPDPAIAVAVAVVVREDARNAATPPNEPWLDHPFGLELSILVVDANGLPMDGETVRVAATNTPLHDAGSTDADGRLSLRWRSRTPTAAVILEDGYGLLHRVPVSHGRPASVALVGVEKILGSFAVRGDRRRSVVWRSTALHPFAAFSADVASVPSSPDTSLDATSWFLLVDCFGDEGALHFHPEARFLHGLVLRADGAPAANERVALLDENGRSDDRTHTNDDGRFTIAVLGDGARTVRVGGGDHGIGVASIAPNDVRQPARVVLDRGNVLRGHVAARTGDLGQRFRVEWHAADGSWCDATTTAENGDFTSSNVASTTGDVFVIAPDSRLPVAWAKRVSTNDILPLRDSGAVISRLVVRAPETTAAANEIEVRAWQLDTGFGVTLWRGEDGRWRSDRLAAGSYAVEAIVRGAGAIDLGRHWLDGKTTVDLGPLVVPAPGRVRFTSASPLHGAELLHLRADFDTRVALDDVPLEHEVLLPAGEYVFAFRRDGDVRFVRFEVRSGEETMVTVQ